MKRIALIRNSYSFDVGGAEVFPVTLAKILANSGYEPILLSANNTTLTMAEHEHLKTVRSPWWSFQNFSGIGLLLFPAYLVWLLFTTLWYCVFFFWNHIDIVHPQSRDDFIAATLAAKLLRKRVVWTDHADLKYIYMNHSIWYRNPVGKMVYATSKLADHVTIESNSERKLVEASLGQEIPHNYHVLYIGVVDSCVNTERTQGIDKVVLVSTSRLVKAKGIGELLAAFKSINNENILLKICGDGPDAAVFKSMAGDVHNIEFLGHVDDVVSVLQQADIMVHPTYHEGFGLSLVEAEMCALPIIASGVDSVFEIVKDGISGILVEPKNVDVLAQAISRLVKDPVLRRKMGRAGRKIFLENFQFDKIVREKFLPLYID